MDKVLVCWVTCLPNIYSAYTTAGYTVMHKNKRSIPYSHEALQSSGGARSQSKLTMNKCKQVDKYKEGGVQIITVGQGRYLWGGFNWVERQ